MMNKLIYTDNCSLENMGIIKSELNIDVMLMFDDKVWSVNECMKLITTPEIELAVINEITEKTVIEIGLLNFMCKPILVTSKAIELYPLIKSTVDYTSTEVNLLEDGTKFIQWYKNYWS